MLKLLWPVLLIIAAISFWREEVAIVKVDDAFTLHGERAIVVPPKTYTEVTHYKKNGALSEKKYTGTTYEADITFRTRSGTSVTVANKNVPQEALQKMANGEPIQVEYLPEDPSKVRFFDQPHVSHDVNTKTFIGMILIGVIWLFFAFRSGK